MKKVELKQDFSKMSKEEIDNLLNEGFLEYQRGETVPVQYAFEEIRKKYGIERDK
ncbi:MAG TPA: hypothetical protein P5064_08930 [Clostridia bacterium]|nr:hypothetical protein [Clostridiaceae bacterium]HOF26837.1 hypothetical protein [Clostridia bacterium]HOM34981.1 hypothetical protein [Clostridia bacterium]HOR90152.1 hypothetical protein [Clostridia bacterium]HOT70414.1 hypothetical protein [Clostridia bacterium]